LNPCDLEPALNRVKLSKYRLIYRCGPTKFTTLNDYDSKIAIYSSRQLSDEKAIEVVKDYLAYSGDIFMIEQRIRLTDTSEILHAYQSEHQLTILNKIK
jgi:hypothetical protein